MGELAELRAMVRRQGGDDLVIDRSCDKVGEVEKKLKEGFGRVVGKKFREFRLWVSLVRFWD